MSRAFSVLLVFICASPALTQGLDVPSLLPARPVFHVEVTPGAIRDHGAQLSVAKILDEPHVKKFIAPLTQMIDRQLAAAGPDLESATGLKTKDLVALWDARLTVTVLDNALDDNGNRIDGAMGVVVTLDVGAKGGKILEAAVKLEAFLASQVGVEFTDRKLAGRTVRHADLSGEHINWVIHDNTLLVTTMLTDMERILQAIAGRDIGSILAKNPTFARVKQRIVGDGTVVFAYVDMARIIETLTSSLPDEARDALMLWGLTAYGSLGYGIDLAGDAIRDRFYATVSEGNGWEDVWQSAKGRLRTAELLPADTALYSAGMVNFSGAFSLLMKTLDEGYLGEAAEVRGVLADLSKNLGVDIERDVVSALGPEYALYLSYPRRAIIPDVGLVFEVGESVRPKFRRMIDNVRTALDGHDQIGIKSFSYRNHTIHYLDLLRTARDGAVGRSGPHTVKPSFAMVGDFLVITLWPQALKNLIAGIEEKTPRLVDRPDYAALHKRLQISGDLASLFYVDMKSAAGFLLDNATPILQSLVPTAEEVPIDVALLPPSEAITKHLFGMLGAAVWDEDGGIYSEVISPVGAAPSYVVTVGAVAAALVVPMIGVASEPAWGPMAVNKQDPRARCKKDLESLELGVQAFEAWEGRLPKATEWPSFLTKGSPNHPGPYMASVPLDPWGSAYVYSLTADGAFTVTSFGADMKPGGEGPNADMSNLTVR